MQKNKIVFPNREINVGDCIVRQMTNEERIKYGLSPLEHEDHTIRIIPAKKNKQKVKGIINDKTNEFCKKILKEREHLGLSQKEFAKIVGVSQSTINNIENLKWNLTEKTIKKLNEYFKKKDGD